MKFKGVGIAAVVLCGVTAGAGSLPVLAQQSHDFWFLGEAQDKSSLHYIDAASIAAVSRGVEQAWFWHYYSKWSAEPKLVGLHDVFLDEVNCRTRENRALQITRYHWGIIVASQSVPARWSYVVPDSIGKKELEFICSGPTSSSTELHLGRGATLENHVQQIFDSAKFNAGEIVDGIPHDGGEPSAIVWSDAKP